jgi:WD40 repeat protein
VATLTAHTEDLFTCAFSPDGTMLATGGYDDTVKLWNVSDWSLRFNFNGNGGNVYGLAFTHDSARIGYTDGEGHTFQSLFFVGFVLFFITLGLNMIGNRFVARIREAY